MIRVWISYAKEKQREFGSAQFSAIEAVIKTQIYEDFTTNVRESGSFFRKEGGGGG